MNFRPFVHTVRTVRSDSIQPDISAAPPESRSVVFPVSQVINLALVTASGTRDFFLWHPYRESVQDVLLGADENVNAPAGLTVQLVQVNAEVTTVLTEPESIGRLTIDPVSLSLPGQVLDGPVFLRVVAPTTSQSFFVTIHAMTSDIR